MCGTFIKHCNLQHVWAKAASPGFELELCGEDCDKPNVYVRCSLAIFCELTHSGVQMNGGKNGAKNDCFLNCGARAG